MAAGGAPRPRRAAPPPVVTIAAGIAVHDGEAPRVARHVAGAVADQQLGGVAAGAQVVGGPDVVAVHAGTARDVAAVHAQGDRARVDSAAVVAEARGDLRQPAVGHAIAL